MTDRPEPLDARVVSPGPGGAAPRDAAPGGQHTALYGTSRALGGVEFLRARFTSHRFAPHIHPFFAVGAVERGACRIWHRGTSHEARPGDLVLINPGDPHSTDPALPAEWEYCALYFSAGTAAAWGARTAPGDALHLRGVVGRDEGLAARLVALCRQLADDPEGRGGESGFGALVRDLFARFGARPEAGLPPDQVRPAVRVRRYIDAHFAELIRIDALAEVAGQSPCHVIHAFTREFGMPPYTYLTQVRVARACELLREGRPVSDTAFTVGFHDQSHLTRFFKRIVGVPPGLFARAVAARGTPARVRGSARLVPAAGWVSRS